uniref:C2H2-type domain-containing protein n=1 Tax=Erpetoichthys calabaricus TaxID=27687 RepID=A0A8C4SCH1_ERPCA
HPTASTIENHGKGTTKPRRNCGNVPNPSTATISIYFQERPHASPRVYNPAQHLSISLLFSGPLDHGHYEVLMPLKYTRDNLLVTSFDAVGMCTQGAHPLARHTNMTSPAHSPLPEKHLKTHSPEHMHSTQDFQCTFCSKSFRVQRYLNAHLKKHNTNRMMQCEHCQQCFKTTCTLKKHLRTHSTLTFNCTFCNEDFTGEMDLHNHMQIHSTQTIVCKLCDKHFHARRYLTNHLKTHSLMNSFQCQHCSKTFITKSFMHKHLTFCCFN